jgi:outer membrane lipoprotein-sorting protein
MKSFQGDFLQIIESENSKISYKGSVKVKKPNKAVWHYKTPVEKSLYIDGYRVIVVDHDLEQITIRKLKSRAMFFSILNSSKRVDKGRYVTALGEQEYLILADNGLIGKIAYLDQFDNSVEIRFSEQKRDSEILDTDFIPELPVDYDKIYQ